MSTIKFRMHAWSDAAGKYNHEAVRGGNEDNFYVDDNLCDEFPSRCESDVTQILCEYGLIMAVADGMGGMNAGEVASEIAVKTIQDYFAPGKITAEIAKNHHGRGKYLEKLIVEADTRIKEDAKHNPEHEGMGSTIILAWIVNNELTLSWCGDSRAYRFNPAYGIELISEDHSYVQELVHQGFLTYEQTFEHPQGNIITRSLGDESKKAEPETRFFNVYDNDIILLCSDGLSGVLRDRRTPDGEGGYFPGENLEDIIRENSGSLVECREALWKAAENAGWYDNVTAILCEIQTGAGIAPIKQDTDTEEIFVKPKEIDNRPWWTKSVIKLSPKNISLILVFLIIIVALCFGGYKGYKLLHKHFPKVPVDSTCIVEPKGGGFIEDKQIDKVNVDSPNETTNVPAFDLSPANPTKSSGQPQTDLIEKAGSILESSNAQTPTNTSEINLVQDELTKACNPTDEASDTKSETFIVESFLLKQITVETGKGYSSLVNKYTGKKFHKLVVLNNEMKIVPNDSLKADKSYIILLLSKCSSPEELFALYKTSGNQLHNHKDEIDALNENIQTVEDFLKAVKKEQPYTIARVEQK